MAPQGYDQSERKRVFFRRSRGVFGEDALFPLHGGSGNREFPGKKKRSMRLRNIRIIIFLFVGLIIGFLVSTNLAFYLTEDSRFRGTQVPQDYKYTFQRPHEEIFLNNADSGRTHGLLFTQPASKGVIFFLPGTHSDVEIAYKLVSGLMDYGHDLLIMEYRGCGKSTGTTNESAFYNDSYLMYAELKKRYGDSKIVLCGHSLGGVIAAQIAAAETPAKALLVASLYSINEKYNNRRPWRYRKYKLETFPFVEKSNCPIYFLCGSDDVLARQSKKLMEHSKNGDSLILIDKAGHLDIFRSNEFKQVLSNILN